MQNRARFAHEAARRIELNFADRDRHSRVEYRRGGTPDRGSQARGEFRDREGLGDVIVGARIECFNLVGRGVTSIFGPVRATRLAYRNRREANLYPADAKWI